MLPAAPTPVDISPAPRTFSGALKFACAVAFLFLTGGPAVMAQYDDNSPAAYWRQERQRMQARQPQAQPQRGRQVEQRPTRLIRNAAPKKGFTREVAQPAPANRPQQATPPAVAAPQSPAATPTPAATLAPTPEQQQAAAPAQPLPNALRIVVLGDNVGQLLARGLEEAYRDQPQIAISRQTRDTSGLVNTRFFDWSDAVRKLLASGEKVDIAVMMLGSNDAQEMQEGANRLRIRSDEWVKAYRARIEAIATQFRDRKIPLVWVGTPIMRGERLSAEMLALNEFYRDGVQKSGGVYVDIWEAFVDDRSRFTLFGPDINGQIVKLRAADGVHFTPQGARKLAFFLEAPLKRLIDDRRPRTDPLVAAVAPAARPEPATPPAQAPASPASPASPCLPCPPLPPLPPRRKRPQRRRSPCSPLLCRCARRRDLSSA